jgi:hypothetical protein
LCSFKIKKALTVSALNKIFLSKGLFVAEIRGGSLGEQSVSGDHGDDAARVLTAILKYGLGTSLAAVNSAVLFQRMADLKRHMSI